MKISRAASVNGTVRVPGDKSISHRAALIASLAAGETRIDGFATGKDCAATLSCLTDLGVPIGSDASNIVIRGVGKSGFTAPSHSLDCGNSGTTMRLLAGILAGQDITATLVGDASLSRRPMGRIIEPLTRMGATITSASATPPLTVTGRDELRSIDYKPETPSAQVKSCILLAGLNAEGVTTVVEPVATRDHTERMLAGFGANIDSAIADDGSRTISVSSDATLTARDVTIPGDISSAAFFIAAALCLEGSDILIPGVGINPTRTAFLKVLIKAGYCIDILDEQLAGNEPVGAIRAFWGPPAELSEIVLEGPMIAGLIDEIPILAVLGTQMPDGITIRGAGELRLKETDRIAAIADNLGRMGGSVTETDDGLRIERSLLKGAKVDSFNDHRIAMAFTIAGLFADGVTEIQGSECVDISYPGFFETLSSVVRLGVPSDER